MNKYDNHVELRMSPRKGSFDADRKKTNKQTRIETFMKTVGASKSKIDL